MPIIKSAKKRAKQAEVRRVRNTERKDSYKQIMRSIKKDAAAGKDCRELVRQLQSSVDHATKHNIIHKNKAARLKHQAVTIAKASKASKVSSAKSAPKSKKAAAEPKTTVAKKAAKSTGDDLTIIEGVGPKIGELLVAANIKSFSDLAVAKTDAIKEILEAAGSRYKVHDPTSWPEQAQLAADGKMDELKDLQDRLDGGK